MEDFIYLTNCCLCNSDKLKLVISLAKSPPANELVKDPIKQDYFPLDAMQCQECGHHQLSGEVNPNRVFTDYLYVAGTNKTNVEHFENYANKLIDKFKLNEKSFVFEIGSNDGTMLQAFKKNNIKVLGIDPAKQISEAANNNGITTINDFFSNKKALEISTRNDSADLIIANNVLAHTSQLRDIVNGIKVLLKQDGVLVMEISYFLDVLEDGLFDLFYNEHIHSHLITPLTKFFAKNNMFLYDVEHLPNHGGSLRIYIKNSPEKMTDTCLYYLSKEDNINEKIVEFNKKVLDSGKKLKRLLTKIKKDGKTIGAFGFAAKATTLLHQFDIGKEYIDFIVDSNPLKQNLYTPGHNIPVFHPDEMYKRNPDYMLILAWNFANSIMDNHKKYNGKWIVPLPILEIYG